MKAPQIAMRLRGHGNRSMCWGRVFALIAALLAAASAGAGLPGSALAQGTGGEGKAMALRPDVVKITATPGRDAVPQTGFGFIVSQQGSELVVVTADHVVRGAGGPQEGDIGLGVLDPLHNGTKSGFCGGATPSPSERSSGHSRRAAGTG